MTERLACLVVAHNLGDAVIQSGFFRRLEQSGYAEQYVIWTRPSVAFLFAATPFTQVVCSEFPIGTSKQMTVAKFMVFLKAAWTIRRLRPSVSIDLIGDFRDRAFGRLVGAQRHEHIGWADDHSFTKLIRNPFGPGHPLVTVPASHPSVYAGYELMLAALMHQIHDAGLLHAPTKAAEAASPPTETSMQIRVGLHPFASQSFRLWPTAHWQELARRLLAAGIEPIAFGAPSELGALQAMFDAPSSAIRLVTGTIPDFAAQVKALDLMVGLDSFSVHMAERQGVRSVMINAGQPPKLWAPTGAISVASSGGCKNYPCYNVPSCIGTAAESICVRSVSVDAVLEAVSSQLEVGRNAAFSASLGRSDNASRSVEGPGVAIE